MADITLTLPETARLREVAGELGRNFKVIGKTLDAHLAQRGDELRLNGPEAELAARVVQELYELVGGGVELQASLVEHACRLARDDPDARLSDFFNDVVFIGHRQKSIFPRSVRQRGYVEAIRAHDVVFGVGPAGTGKTYLAMAMALAALKRNDVRRIVLTRPAVEAGEKLGYLPGDLAEKVNPYLRPLYDALYDMVDFDRAARLIERQIIEVAPLAFMRGRTLSDAFVILDEAQNTTGAQMKMFLTRLGMGAKAVITGDVTQVDLPRHRRSGLIEATHILRDVERIAFVRFNHADVVRHRLVSDIIQAYDRHAAGAVGGEE